MQPATPLEFESPQIHPLRLPHGRERLWFTVMVRLGIVLVLIGQLLASSARSGERSGVARTEGSELNSAITSSLPPGLTPSVFARALLVETNRVRKTHQRRPLSPRPELDAAADDQAAFMALTWKVQHESFLRGQATPTDRVREHGLVDVTVSENVAMTSLGGLPEEFSAERIAATLVEQWYNSPGHRETLLSPRLTHFGGSVRLVRLLGQWRAYGVQVFMVDTRTTRRH